MIAAALLLLAASPAAAPAGSPATCAAAIRKGDPAGVPSACWRVGPLTIGMSRDEVHARLGRPSGAYDVEGVLVRGPARLGDEIYVFPHDLGRRLARRPAAAIDFQLLELTFDGERLVRISNAPGSKVSSPRCARPVRAAAPAVIDPQSFAPFERFAGVRVGEPMARVERVLGRRHGVSKARDFLDYAPLPLTLATYDARRLSGFAVAADEDAVVQGAAPSIALDLDPATCRARGFRVLDRPGV